MNRGRRMLVGAVLAACTATGYAGSNDLFVTLDQRTGTTQQITREPWVLALDQPHLAAHARDYIALNAVEISNAGKRHQYLAAFYWSTVPGRNDFAGDSPALHLLIDDRDLTLAPISQSVRDAGISEWPMRLPGRDAKLVLYDADAQLLRQIATAVRLRAKPQPVADLPADIWFEPWRDGRASFRAFASQVAGLP